MKKKFQIFFLTAAMMLALLPGMTFAAGLVPDCGTAAKECGFTDLMTLVNKVINFIFTDMVIPIAAIMFAYAGFLMMSAGGESAHARGKAKTIFTNTVTGLVIGLVAWLVVHTILKILGFDGSWIGI